MGKSEEERPVERSKATTQSPKRRSRTSSPPALPLRWPRSRQDTGLITIVIFIDSNIAMFLLGGGSPRQSGRAEMLEKLIADRQHLPADSATGREKPLPFAFISPMLICMWEWLPCSFGLRPASSAGCNQRGHRDQPWFFGGAGH